MLVIFGLILDLDVFKQHGFEIFLSLVIFNFPFIMIANIICFVFKKSETAFKYVLVLVFAGHMVTVMLDVVT